MSEDRITARMEVEIDGQVVTLTINCADHYAAMQLYDEICESANRGHVMLDMGVIRNVS